MIRSHNSQVYNKKTARPYPVTSDSNECFNERNTIQEKGAFDNLNHTFENNLNHIEHKENTTLSHYHNHFDDKCRLSFREDVGKEYHEDYAATYTERSPPAQLNIHGYDTMTVKQRTFGGLPSIGNSSNISSLNEMVNLGSFANFDQDHALFDLNELEGNIDKILSRKQGRSENGSVHFNNHFEVSPSRLEGSCSSLLKTHNRTSPSSLPFDGEYDPFTTNTTTFVAKGSRKIGAKLATVSSTRHKHWSKEEDNTLRSAITQEGTDTICWEEIARKYFNTIRSGTQCKMRWKNHLQPGLVRGCWNADEDRLVHRMVLEGFQWSAIARQLPGRKGDSIRDRYVNYLDPSLKKSPWTEEEDTILFQNQRILGNKWAKIGKLLPGRSASSIKNRYHNRKTTVLRNIKKAKKGNAARKQVRVQQRVQIFVEPNKCLDEDSLSFSKQHADLDMDLLPDIVVGI